MKGAEPDSPAPISVATLGKPVSGSHRHNVLTQTQAYMLVYERSQDILQTATLHSYAYIYIDMRFLRVLFLNSQISLCSVLICGAYSA